MTRLNAFLFFSMISESADGGRRGDHRSNHVVLFAVAIVACFWAALTCHAQIQVRAYITNNVSNDVSVIDTGTNSVVGTPIPVGILPEGVAVSPDGRFVYVPNTGSNTVSVINAVTNTVVASVAVGNFPIGVAFTPNGQFAYVANRYSNTVSVINTTTNAVVASPAVGIQPLGVTVSPNGQFAYVSNYGGTTVSVIDTATNAVVASPTAGSFPLGIAVSPNGQFLYVTNGQSSTVTVINTATNAVVATPAVQFFPIGVAVTPDGKFVYVSNYGNSTVSVIDTTTNTTVKTIAANLGSNTQGVAITPNGQFVYVANTTSNNVSVISTATQSVVGPAIPVGSSPVAFGSFLGPNIIVAQGGPLMIANDTALTHLGFGTFVDFNGGTLQTTGSLITARTISLLTLGGTIDTNGFDSVFSGAIINSGSLTKIGAGTLTLSGNNSYSGGTNILGGVISVSGDTDLGTGNIVIGNKGELLTTGATFSSGKTITLGIGGGTLASTNGETATYGGAINGSGPLIIGDGINQGTIVLSATNTYSGGTTINRAILEIGADVNLGAAASGGLIFNGGILKTLASFGTVRATTLNAAGGIFEPSAGTTFTEAGTIAGVGGLTKIGAGTVILEGNNDYTGGTTVVAGTLKTGSAGGFVSDTAYTVNGGTLDLNNFPLTMASLNGTGGVVSLGSAALTVNNSGTNIYSGIVQGTGSLTKIGGGALTLSGNNTYSGGTQLNAGTLVVNSEQALGLGNVVVNGGILRADPLPINVKGNYTQNAGGTLQLSLGGTAPGQYNFLNVGGRATLGGTLQLFSLNGFQPKVGDRLTLVLAAGGVSGQFANVLDPFTGSLSLVYQPNSVVLEFASSFAPFAQTPNQLAVAAQIDRVASDPREAQLISFLQSEPIGNLGGDFEKISPDSLSALYEISFSAANVQAANLENRFAEIRNGSSGFTSSLNLSNSPGTMVESQDGKAMIEPNKNVMMPSPENKWGVWSSGSGQFVDVNGDGNGKGYDFSTGGVSVGLDYRLTKDFAVGAAIGYAHTWTNLTGNGSIDVDSGRGGLYAAFSQGGFYLNGYLGGAYSSYYAKRAALGGGASGSTNGGEFDGYVGSGYEFRCGGFTFGPIGSLEYTDVEVRGYNENGSLAPLRIISQSEDSLRTNLGLSASYSWKTGRVELRPSVRASWQHEYAYSALPINAQFASGAGSAFTVYGAAEGHDSAVIDAGIDVRWTPTIGTYFGYDGEVGRSNYSSNSVICSMHVDF
jgi:YVTN family beta-propeller protein/autotransporter-associated beta strand protein